MNKTYLIFRHEFLHTIKRIGWIIMTLIVPLLALLGIGLMALVTTLSDSEKELIYSIGFVDEAGIIHEQTTVDFSSMTPFGSREDASQALISRSVSEYIIIPSDFLSSRIIQRYTLEKELNTHPGTVALIKSFLTVNLLKDKVPPDMVILIVSPLNLEVTRVTDKGEIAVEQLNIANLIIPGVFSLLMGLALMLGASSLVSGLGEEKESRLIEVLFSSVSIRQLLMGKILALGAAGLLQVALWLISVPLILYLAPYASEGFMSNIQIPGNFILLGTVYFILGYLMFAILSIGVGAISSNSQEGTQLSMFYTLASFIPLWFFSLLMAFPNSSIWVVLSIFPITAPVQIMVRLGVSEIPIWQILTSIGVLGLSIVGGLSLSIKIFRMNMLMHGKRPRLKEIFLGLKNS